MPMVFRCGTMLPCGSVHVHIILSYRCRKQKICAVLGVRPLSVECDQKIWSSVQDLCPPLLWVICSGKFRIGCEVLVVCQCNAVHA